MQVQPSGGSGAFCIVGLPDEAVGAKTPVARASGQTSRSARGDDGVLKVTRTIPDLDLSRSIARLHATGLPARHGGAQGSASDMPGSLA